MESQPLILAGVLVAALVLLWLLIRLLIRLIGNGLRVAGHLFEWAAEQGFLGVAAYAACWIFMFPLMVIICLIGGALLWMAERTVKRDLGLESNCEAERLRQIGPNDPLSENEARLWEEKDKRYKEAEARRRSERFTGDAPREGN